jgi:hypothetical protein
MEAVIVRRTILLVLTMTLIAGGSLGKGKGSISEFSGLEDLTKQEGLFEMTMIHTDADFSRYNKLFPRTVELEFRDQGRKESESVTGSMVGRRGSRKARPNRKDVAKFEQILNDAFAADVGEWAQRAAADLCLELERVWSEAAVDTDAAA